MGHEFKIPMSTPNIGKEELEAISLAIKSGWPSQGKITEEFESLLSKYLSSNVVTVNNGSAALMSSLLAHGIKPGDTVVVPAFTFIATSSIPKILGAKIVLADVDKNTLNITPESVEAIVKRKKVKSVIVVDVAGLSVDIDAFSDLSKRYNFTLIEDAAQAFGTEYKKRKLGSFSHTTIFSFQIAKQLTTIEGGCIATSDKNIIKKISQIKDYGRNKKERYIHDIVGTNFRTTDLQSAMGITQLKKVEEHISQRNKIASEYMKKIKGIEFQTIPRYASRHSYMIFFALAKDKKTRDQYIKHLVSDGIDARKSWTPLNKQPCNPELHYACPNAEDVFERAFTLPIYNTMTINDANMIINSCNSIQ